MKILLVAGFTGALAVNIAKKNQNWNIFWWAERKNV